MRKHEKFRVLLFCSIFGQRSEVFAFQIYKNIRKQTKNNEPKELELLILKMRLTLGPPSRCVPNRAVVGVSRRRASWNASGHPTTVSSTGIRFSSRPWKEGDAVKRKPLNPEKISTPKRLSWLACMLKPWTFNNLPSLHAKQDLKNENFQLERPAAFTYIKTCQFLQLRAAESWAETTHSAVVSRKA